jgi:hypothetical protein
LEVEQLALGLVMLLGGLEDSGHFLVDSEAVLPLVVLQKLQRLGVLGHCWVVLPVVLRLEVLTHFGLL